MSHYVGQFWKCEYCRLGGPDRTQGERRAERVAQSPPTIAESILWKVKTQKQSVSQVKPQACSALTGILNLAMPDHLSPEDLELVETARNIIRIRYKPDWHVVGAALRTRNGRIFTGVHLEPNCRLC